MMCLISIYGATPFSVHIYDTHNLHSNLHTKKCKILIDRHILKIISICITWIFKFKATKFGKVQTNFHSHQPIILHKKKSSLQTSKWKTFFIKICVINFVDWKGAKFLRVPSDTCRVLNLRPEAGNQNFSLLTKVLFSSDVELAIKWY